MKELTVWYCPRCGHYNYFKPNRDTVCPLCNACLRNLLISYQDFMHLSPDKREQFLIQDMLANETSLSKQVHSARHSFNYAYLVATLISQIHELTEENQKLDGTIQWMHDTIWELVAQRRILESD